MSTNKEFSLLDTIPTQLKAETVFMEIFSNKKVPEVAKQSKYAPILYNRVLYLQHGTVRRELVVYMRKQHHSPRSSERSSIRT